MPRPQGSANIPSFESRQEIATTSAKEVVHLARQEDLTPLSQFEALLRNQRNFLHWIDTRHIELSEAKKIIDPDGRGPKDSVYRKYRWYTEQQSLLEAVNGFEVFYKNSIIALGRSLRRHVSPHKIKGTVDAKTLWISEGSASFISLIFEHQLFHSLESIDDATNMIIGARRYMPNNQNGPLYNRARALQCAFQLRHTLSHNQGRVTQSDSAKFAAVGFKARKNEVLDPGKDHLGDVVRDLLREEAQEFTSWTLEKTAAFLANLGQHTILKQSTKKAIEDGLGTHPALESLHWQ